jgi:hypothetical protein
MFKSLIIVLSITFSFVSSAAYKFERDIKEVQIFSDRVRIDVGTTYGTCGDNEGWWGWMITNPASAHWLSLVLSAQAQGKKITVHDEHGSCGGIGDGVGLEALYLKVK